ncbi:TAXI family TRAP transporter solute-binding subunit [Arcobacter sp. YIC-464]|uniref:TAXI family TRAP transporter solute-binding subunit n=1 Tax=Arcobacter sp. YIC-464 TaxID=3376631 RepID=UPI003C15DE00
MKNKFILVSIPVIALVIGVFYFTAQFIKPSPKKEITIATGSKSGQYYQTALKYQKLLEKERVKVNIVTSTGSIENIKLLEEKKVDIAFVQNGTVEHSENLESLASIYYEPLWIFYNTNIKDLSYIQDLKNKKIAIGENGSGTKDLALNILNINGIYEKNSTFYNYNSEEASKKLINKKIDALFLVTSPDSKIIKELLNNKDISLFSFKRANAYSRKFHYLSTLDLHEGTIDLLENIPKENKKLLASTATLVVHKDFSDELIRILLKKVTSVHDDKTLFSQENEFPNSLNLPLPQNEEASIYLTHGDTWLEKIFPYWIASTLDRLKILLIPLITLSIPLFKGAFPLYRWSIRSKIYRWYDVLQDLDLSLDKSSKEELIEKLSQLEELKREIKDETKVPLAYMGEYYDLIMHLELIISKANMKLNNQ